MEHRSPKVRIMFVSCVTMQRISGKTISLSVGLSKRSVAKTSPGAEIKGNHYLVFVVTKSKLREKCHLWHPCNKPALRGWRSCSDFPGTVIDNSIDELAMKSRDSFTPAHIDVWMLWNLDWVCSQHPFGRATPSNDTSCTSYIHNSWRQS